MGCAAGCCSDDQASIQSKRSVRPPVLMATRTRRMTTKPSKIARYCFVIRHGQRADQSKEFLHKYRGHPDAFLTKKGHAQAAETG